jgi:hypothetical protein
MRYASCVEPHDHPFLRCITQSQPPPPAAIPDFKLPEVEPQYQQRIDQFREKLSTSTTACISNSLSANAVQINVSVSVSVSVSASASVSVHFGVGAAGTVKEAAEVDAYLLKQFQIAKVADNKTEEDLLNATGLIAQVDVPRERTKLELDRGLLNQQGLVDAKNILREHESQVLDVTLPKDPRAYVKAKPASARRSAKSSKPSTAAANAGPTAGLGDTTTLPAGATVKFAATAAIFGQSTPVPATPATGVAAITQPLLADTIVCRCLLATSVRGR